MDKHFYQWKNSLFRHGFLYKPFSLKQIDSQNIKPTHEERQQFIQIFEKSTMDGNVSSSDAEETIKFFKGDLTQELIVGEKVYVITGELQQAFGEIVGFEDGGNTVNFKPKNIEGFDETVGLDKSMLVKYFE